MKTYIHSILLSLCLCITSLLSAQSLYNNNQDPTTAVKQALPSFTNKDYATAAPVLQEDVMGEYGVLGFVLATCLGLVVFIVKKDRDTMSRLVDSLNNNVQAISTNSNKIELLERTLVAQGEKISSQIEALNRTIRRGNDS